MPRSRENGVALPLAIFAITILTVMLAASFTRVRSEVQLAGGSSDMVSAFGVAQSGLNGYIGLNRDVRPPDGDSLRINVVGGYADVVAHIVRNDTLNGKWTYLIRSTGLVVDPAVGPEPRAVHTVSQFSEWQWGYINTPGAWTSIRDVIKSSALPPATDPAVTVFGIDACGVTTDIAGIRARDVPDTTGFNSTGSPPIATHGNSNAVSLLTGIDWNAVWGEGINPDSDSLIPNDTTYRTYRIPGDVSAGNFRGTGLLIVGGRLTTTGNYFLWDGLVLIGDRIRQTATDSTVIHGLFVTGLNWQTGGPLTNSVVDENPIIVSYDSCKIKAALRSVRGFVPIQNGWVDHWATY